MTFAAVKIAGKQYLVSPGMKLKAEKIKNPPEDRILKFGEVLLFADGDKIEVGRPFVPGAEVKAELIETKKGEKTIVFRYHSKTRLRVKKGHRQQHSVILIKDIGIGKNPVLTN